MPRRLLATFFLVSLSFSAFGVTRSWTGAVSTNWSEPGNWSPNGIPASSDSLVFPGGAPLTMNNDLPAGTIVGPMLFNDSYTLNGNSLRLYGDLSFGPNVNFVCNTPLTLEQPIKFGAAITSKYNGRIFMVGPTLTVDTYNTDFNGPVDGTGAIILNGSGASFHDGGSLNGSITGSLNFAGTMTVAVNGDLLSGDGSLGNVITSSVMPGPKCPCASSDPHTGGTINTKSLQIGSTYYVDLVPNGLSDSIHVTGSVTIGGATLLASINGFPVTGQKFTIIDNDGTDPVSGTFANLPEGATVHAGAYTFTISYHGGDGNDVVLTTAQVKKSWTGAASGNWSDPANWSPQAIPVSGEALVFPTGSRSTMNNDLPAGFTVGPMTFNDTYTLNGNRLLLNGDLSFDQSNYPFFICNAPLTLGQDTHFGAAIQSDFNGAIDLGNHRLTVDTYNTTFKGAVNGSGSIVLNGAGARFEGGGTMAGTIYGTLDVEGSMPNADVATSPYSEVTGDGSLGSLNVNVVRPGKKVPAYTDDPHTVGVLHTKSVSMPMYVVDIVGGIGSDRLQVTGSVTLNSTLSASVTGAPTPGESFTIIDNDGTDAVIGTFNSAPEGALLHFGSYLFSITYHGGDGNDVVLTAVPSDRSWTGAVSANWSDPGNWIPQGVPLANEPLIFPQGGRSPMNNDLADGFSVGPMAFYSSYTLNGNRLRLTGNLSFDQSTYPFFVCNTDLTLGASVIFGAAIQSDFNGTIDLAGHALRVNTYNTTFRKPVNSAGSIELIGAGAQFLSGGTFGGSLNGTLDIEGSMANANVAGNEVTGNGTLGTVTVAYVRPGAKVPPYTDDPHTTGVLHTKSLLLQGAFFVDLAPGGTSDSVQVTGTVDISDAQLFVTVPSGVPAIGQSFTIIDNDGTEAVQGTFRNLAEGARVNASGYAFRISYHGGDGNDVVLTRAAATSMTLSASPASLMTGQQVTFTANVTADSGIAAGSIVFADGTTTLATAPLQNGSAQFTTSALHAGTHSITAIYGGDGGFFGSSAAPLSYVVQQGATSTTISANKTSVTYGELVTLTVNVSANAPASGTPSGSIVIHSDGKTVANATLVNGSASIPVKLHGGLHAVTASYAGNSDFTSSDSSVISIKVNPAATSLTVSADQNPVPAGRSVTLTVDAGGAIGTITVSDDSHVLAQQSINGIANVHLHPLSVGVHPLLVSFAETDDYKPSSATISVVVSKPVVALDDMVVLEGDESARTVLVPLHLSAPLGDPVSVTWSTADASAVAGRDYDAANGTIVFAPGETEHAIPIVIHGNTTPEDDRSFIIVLANVTNAALDHPSATVVITNDDATWKKLGTFTYSQTLTLDLYAPAAGDSRRPLILWIPGSTSYGGDGSTSTALRQTRRGYLVAVVRYRDPSAARFPAQLDDLQAALHWLRANADQFQIIPDRIAAWGNGAGAHLAALLGTASTERVQAVIDWNGATDLAALNADSTCGSIDHDDPASAESQLIGCALPACVDGAKAASPLTFADSNSASFLIMHGGDNCVVGAEQSRKLNAKLKTAGADSMLFVLNGVGLVDPFWSSATANAAVDEFLDVHLKGAPVRHRPAH